MTEPLPRGDVHLHVVAYALRRFAWLIITAVVVLGGAAGAYAYLGTHTYKSTSAVLLRPLSGNALSSTTSSSSQSTNVAMQTEATLAKSAAVTRLASSAVHERLPLDGSKISTSVPVNSQLVELTASGSSARDAQRRADAYARAFLSYRSTLATNSHKALEDRLNGRIKTVQGQLQRAVAAASGKAGSNTQVRLYTSQLSSLQSQISQTISSGSDPGTVVTPASLPANPTGLAPALIVGIGAVVGLLLGLVFALWRERSDDRIRASTEPTLLGLPVLAVLPRPRRRQTRDVAAAIRAESLRKARTGLLALAEYKSTVAVTGVTRGDPALGPAAGLARAIAAADYSVTLIDAVGPRESRPAWVRGASAADSSDAAWSSEFRSYVVDGVRVVNADSQPGVTSDRYAGRMMRELLRRAQQDADYVLVATRPADTAEGMAIMLAAGHVLLVGSDRHTTHENIDSAVGTARRLGVSVLGMLIAPRAAKRPPATATPPPSGAAAEPNAAEDAGPTADDAADQSAPDQSAPDTSGVDTAPADTPADTPADADPTDADPTDADAVTPDAVAVGATDGGRSEHRDAGGSTGRTTSRTQTPVRQRTRQRGGGRGRG